VQPTANRRLWRNDHQRWRSGAHSAERITNENRTTVNMGFDQTLLQYEQRHGQMLVIRPSVRLILDQMIPKNQDGNPIRGNRIGLGKLHQD
jgi:hypothetical protein